MLLRVYLLIILEIERQALSQIQVRLGKHKKCI